MHIIRNILQLFGDKKCLSCRQVGHFFCASCCKNIQCYTPYCYICKKPSDNFNICEACKKNTLLSQIVVLGRYRQEGMKKIIQFGKYYGKYRVYEDILRYNKDFFISYIIDNNAVLIPIPMQIFRRWKRGYNHSEKISFYLGQILNIPVYNNILYKKKCIPQQSRLSKDARVKNIKNSFAVKNSSLALDSTIYLVDDVASTGSTLQEAAYTLKKYGYKDIRAIVLASD